MIFPYAAKYREPIYKLMDKSLDCRFYFCGNTDTSLVQMDYSSLSKCDFSMEEVKLFGGIKHFKGLLGIRFMEGDAVILPGNIRYVTLWLLLILRSKRKYRICFWTHGWYGKEGAIQRIIKRVFYKLSDGIFLYGQYAKDLMIKEGFDENMLFVIHNSLNYEEQLKLRNSIKPSDIYKDHFDNDNPVLIFLGRLTPVKQLDMVVRAVANLKEQGENYNLVFVGDGTERGTLEQLSKVLDVEKQVWFYGACYDEKQNAELVFNADLCVAPGNIGLTAMHVLMFGCPALTHDCFKWQMPEFESIHPGETGDFFEYKNQKSLEEKISGWFKANKNKRDIIREYCYNEIDTQWTPAFQVKVIQDYINKQKDND